MKTTLAEIPEFLCRLPQGGSRTKLIWDRAATHLLNLSVLFLKCLLYLWPLSDFPSPHS